MTISDGMMIFAVIAGPILAVQIQKWIEHWKQTRERKLWVFKTLMQTRGTPLSPLHVQALNMIDLEFTNKERNEKCVLDAWRIYLNHLYEVPQDYRSVDYDAKMAVWSDKTNEYLVELLYQMAQVLSYKFDKVQLKKGAYTPQGHADIELQQSLFRKGMLQIIYGQQPIHVVAGKQSPSEWGLPVPITNTETKPLSTDDTEVLPEGE